MLVSDNQKIFLCREKLTQFTLSRIIPNESVETLRSVLDIMPPSGTTVRVDVIPGLQSINKAYNDIQTDDVFKKHSIRLVIGWTITQMKTQLLRLPSSNIEKRGSVSIPGEDQSQNMIE